MIQFGFGTYLNRAFVRLPLTVLLASVVLSCGQTDRSFDFMSQPTGDGSNKPCVISQFSPAADSTIRVPAGSGERKLFTVITSSSSCQVTFELNGQDITQNDMPGVLNLVTSVLNPGNNTLIARATNRVGSATQTWILSKNNPPTCSQQLPSATGNAIAIGSTLNLNLTATDGDNDPLSFNWNVSGQSVSSSILSVTSSGVTSAGVFTPDADQIGPRLVNAEVFDGLDKTVCSWQVSVRAGCSIASALPSGSVKRVAAAAATSTSFGVVPSDASCTVSWTLNGSPFPVSSSFINVLSSSLAPGNNTLLATVGNSVSSVTQTWTVQKNQAPTCAMRTPASGVTSSVNLPGTLNFSVGVADAESDPVSFEWKINGTNPPAGVFTTTSVGPNSATVFAPTSAYVGSGIVTVEANDGFDTSTCEFPTNVVNTCSFLSSSPNSATAKIAYLDTTSNAFAVTPSNSSCVVDWKVNGNAVGTQGNTINLQSSQFLQGNNILTASMGTGDLAVTKTWTVLRNTPPTCASQLPSATGSTIGLTGNLTLTATASDANSDPVTFDWQVNGSTPQSQYLSAASSGSTSTAIFSPSNSYVGNNTIRASISDGLDSSSCQWSVNVLNACSVLSSAPSTSSFRVASLGATANSFSVTPNDSSCQVTWSLNGASLGVTNPAVSVPSSAIVAGLNTLEATVSNAGSSVTRTWTISKNSPATCQSQTPTAANSVVAIPSALNMSVTAVDAENDSISFNWKLNGMVPSGSIFNVLSSSVTSLNTFTPDATNIGNATVSVGLNDGYDSSSCEWTVRVLPSCTLASPVPSAANHRVSSAGATSTTFSITPNDVSCALSWSLNGSPLSGSNAASLNVLSSSLNAGNNNLTVTASNGSSTATHTWNVIRNVPPTCGSQSPAANGTVIGVNGAVNLTANGSSPASLPLTFAWDLNGVAATATNFSISGSSPQSIATFTPTASNAGANVITATINDGYDKAACSWNLGVQEDCQAISSSPSSATVRVASSASTTTNFAVVPNSPSCTAVWTLNSQALGSTSTFQDIPSSALNPGSNTLVATLSNGTSSVTKTWVVNKNSPPSCGTQNPASAGNIVALPNTLNLTVSGLDTESDALTFAWTLNGQTPLSGIFSTLSSASSSQTTFTPNASHVGGNSVSVMLSDGYDTNKCDWDVTVLPACSIANSSPSAASHRIVAGADTANVFSVTPSDPGCAVTWTLNGSPMSGGAAATKSILSGSFITGDNTLVATASNGSSSATKTWTVNKNTPPACGTQSPATTGTVVGVSGNINLTVMATDANSDNLTFAWKLNGLAATATNFNTTSTASQSVSTFSPAGGLAGTNTISSILNDGYDSTTCSWDVKVQNDCSVTSGTPGTSTVKVSSLGSTTTTFGVVPNESSCATSWKLNGASVGITGNSLDIFSSALNAGTNTVLATVTNGTSTVTRTWTVNKNTPPTCSSQAPAANGTNVALTSSVNLTANASDVDSDTLGFSWKIGGVTPATGVFSVISGASNSVNTFAPTSTYLGNQTVIAEISDGFDSATCSWAVRVLPVCTLSGELPAQTSYRVRNAGSTSTTFGVTPSDTSCAVTWSLNGSTLVDTTNSIAVLSSQLNPGNNTLIVNASNGSTTATRTWTVIRNVPPTCASQSPAANAATLGLNGSINLTAKGASQDSLPLTFSWKLNGNAASNANFSFGGVSPQSVATFSPPAGSAGTNVISAIINDGYDAASCDWNVNVQNDCQVTSSSPSAASLRVANASSTTTNFAVVPNDSSCGVTWSLNGQALGSTANFLNLASSSLSTGANTLTATLSNGTSTSTRSWSVTRNTPPQCSSQTPNATGNTVAVGGSSNFTANGADVDADTLTFAWTMNGIVPTAGVFTTLSSGASSQTAFAPDVSFVGSNNIKATISDGYDTNSCAWTVNVLPACTISASTPSSPSRIAAANASSNIFTVTPSDASCAVTWTLNGSPLSGAAATTKTLASSAFNTGTNTLTATASNGTSSATTTWSVVKNTPPTCDSITPAATGAVVGTTGSINLTANASDANSDALSFAWKLNGNASSATNFSVANTAGQSVATFSPAGGLVGTNTIASVISDGYDTTTCSWSVAVQNNCSVTSGSPSTATVKVASAGSTSTTFSTVPNDSSCAVTWSLNGSSFGSAGLSANVLSSSLNAGSNTLVATLDNGTSSVTRTWTVYKNTAPVCGTQTPAASGASVAIPASLNITANGSDVDSDSLTFSWLLGGVAPSAGIFNVISGPSSSLNTFTPTTNYIGQQTIISNISDGYDSTTCSWAVQVLPACSILSTSPSSNNVRAAAAASTDTFFTVSPSDGSCAVTWTLNGSAIAGGASTSKTISSGALNSGNNILVATASNGSSSTSYTWTVQKNSPPTCSSQSPASTGATVGTTGSMNLTANGADANSDSLTFAWTINGLASPSNFSITDTSTSSVATYSPNGASAGTSTIAATISDGYDTAVCNWTVALQNSCAISSSSPSTSSVRASSVGTTSTSFGVAASDAGCAISWSLNGSSLGATSSFLNLSSSQLNSGTNTLVATLNNGVSSNTRTWTVIKNVPPTCGSQTPAASGSSVAIPASMSLTANGATTEGLPLSFSWTLNGQVPTGSVFNVLSSGTTSLNTFTPTSTYLGTGTIVASINDGYDVGSCSWNVNILPACTIASVSPTSATPKIAAAGSTNNLFTVNPGDASCTTSWTLNGSSVSGVGNTKSIASSNFNTGTNTLVATVSNGSSTVTQTWTVLKNTPPSCGSQTPAASGGKVGTTGTINLTANGTDANADALTFDWSLNGQSSASNFTITGSGNQSVATFAPSISMVGANTVSTTISDGLDSNTCAWNLSVQNDCAFVSTSPSTATTRVAAAGTTTNAFAVTPNDASCAVSWKVNGTALSDAATLVNILSSQFGTGSNTVEAKISNGTSTATRTWTVSKNTVPVCTAQTPAASGAVVAIPGSLNLTASPTDADSDSLTFQWRLNGQSVASSLLSVISSASTSQSTFTPTSGYIGNATVTSTVSDGYDSAVCTWEVGVLPSCAISTSSPVASPYRVSASGDTTTLFTVTPNDTSCTTTWALNGSAVSGTANSQSVSSSSLNTGNNTLVATVSNGSSSVTKTWTVVKNTPPTCASQSPAATGSTVGLSSSINLTANGADANSDSLSFAWTLNGSPSPSNFAVNTSGSSSVGTFSPNGSGAGNNTVAVSISDGYDSAVCSWAVTVQNSCTLAASSPSTSSIRVSSVDSTSTAFGVAPSDSSCAVTWSLNGSTLSTGSSFQNVLSSQLNAGNNTLVASVGNGTSSVTRTWTVVKNTPPTCSSQTPSATGSAVAMPSSINLTANGTTTQGLPLSFSWTINGQTPAVGVFGVISGASSSVNTFTPTANYLGNGTVVASISDGYDSAQCSWSLNILPSCSIASTVPASSSPKVAAAGSTSNTFTVNPSDSSCTTTWTLNGSALTGTTNTKAIFSSSFNTGNNTLVATVSNGSSSASQTWTILKNTPPTCSSQSPAASGTVVGTSGTVNLTANASDANSDSVSFAWTLNGLSSPGSFSVTGSGAQSIAAFSPSASIVGTNTVAATISDGLDSVVCSWNLSVQNDCSFASSSPSSATARIAAAGGTSNAFAVTPSDASCAVSWTLNGSSLSSSAALVNVLSSQFNSGANTLVATLNNGTSSVSRTWTVTKNTPPVCGTQTPSANSGAVAYPASLNMNISATDPNSDALTFAWLVNGQSVASSILSSVSSSTASQATFTPTNGMIGTAAITSTVNDGYDSTVCSWNVAVLSSCAITASSPSTTPYRVAAAAGTNNVFTVTPNEASCSTTWTLNGSPMSGSASNTKAIASSDLNTGNNTLVATVSNGTTSASQTWTVVKNTPPTCSSQTPAATGSVVGSTGTLAMTANGSSAASLPLTFAWTLNGLNASSYFSTSTTGNSSQTVFSPNGDKVGTNSVVATISDGYDTSTCSWNVNVQPSCSVTSSSPGASTRVAAAGSTSTPFSVTPNDASCAVSWTLNGSSLGSSSALVNILSSQLTATTNTLVATVANSTSSTTKSFTIVKNAPPTCSSQTPAATGGAVAMPNSMTLTANATDSNSDALAFAWTLNGQAVSSGVLNVLSSASTSQAVFTPSTNNLGNDTITATISDGYDTATCSWDVQALAACTIPSKSPAAASFKIAAASGTNNTFSVTPSDPACVATWTLNGSSVGGTSNTQVLQSSAFVAGNNTLTATVSNGLSTTTQSWTVVKNVAPTCASQSPAATGTVMSVTGSQTLTANGSDFNNDALSFAWKINSLAATATNFSVNSNGTSSTAVFSPSGSFVGSDTITADISDGYDSATCSWSLTVQNDCAISSASPSGSSIRVSSVGSTISTFVTAANDATCTPTWTLNGVSTGSSSSTQTVSSSALNTGNNTLVVNYGNGTSTASKTWTVTKNIPPTCNSQSPAATGATVGVNQTLALTAEGLSAAGLPLSFSWAINGLAATNPPLTIASAGNTSFASYAPTGLMAGSKMIVATINDGYDTGTCTWNLNVIPQCAVTSASPASSTVRVSAVGSTSTSFGVVANDSSCAISWSVNGVPYGGTTAFQNLLSSDLTSGNNTLTATLTNAVGTTTQSWAVVKNTPPSCTSQTPGASGNTMTNVSTQAFSGTASSWTQLSATWLYDGSVIPSMFLTPAINASNTATTTFKPTTSNVGNGHVVTVQFSDGYDVGQCSWGLNITDPNTVAISACSPITATTAVVKSSGTDSSKAFAVAATGTGLTYSWIQDGTPMGIVTPTLTLNAGSLSIGNHSLVAMVTDAYGNQANCTWTVFRSTPPVINSSIPIANGTYNVNAATTQSFAVNASSPDGRALNYTWTLDSNSSSALPSGASSSLFNPNNNASLLGSHSIMVTVSEGYESVTKSWAVNVSQFSTSCNSLYNGTVASDGGKICTLASAAGIGDGVVPVDDQSAIHVVPNNIVDDGSGNLFFTDGGTHSVLYYNRSASPITMLNKTVPAGTIKVIVGNGANGLTNEGLVNTAFKLDTPMGLAYDAAANVLYVADWGNHRVVRVDSSGTATTFFGTTGVVANNTSTNTDGQAATGSVCYNPAAMVLVNWAGRRWLYVACYNTHAIKRIDIDPASANYGKAYMVVGATGSGATGAGYSDGAIGISGEASTYNPFGMDADAQGNIYWTETVSAHRVRMATTGGGTASFFNSKTINNSAQAIQIRAIDVGGAYTNSGFGTGGSTIQALAATGAINSYAVYSPGVIPTNVCVPITAVPLNSGGNAVASGANWTLSLTNNGSGVFYSDSGCASSITSIALNTGEAQKLFYFRNTVAQAVTITVRDNQAVQKQGTLGVTSGTYATPSKLGLIATTQALYTSCMPVIIQLQNASSQPVAAPSARSIRLETATTGNFYTDSACATTPVSTVTMPSGATFALAYYARTFKAAANSVVSLAGMINAQNTSNVSNSASVPSVGAAGFYTPRDVMVDLSGSTVIGFYVASYSNHSIHYLNNTASAATRGGKVVNAYGADIVVGNSTYTGNYNGDGILGSATNVRGPMGLTKSADGTRLYFADQLNNRLRYLNVSTNNGTVETEVGAGYGRANLTASSLPAPKYYFNSPTGLTIDQTTQKLYVADSLNYRIHELDLTTGLIQPAVGKGTGPATIQNDSPINVLMSQPMGIWAGTINSKSVLMYADQIGGGNAANQNCMIRAWNKDSSSNTIFGESVQGSSISDIVGNYTLGCQPWSFAGVNGANSDGGTGSNMQLNNPEGIASDGTNLYLSLRDSCIVKVNSSGKMSRLIGSCTSVPNPSIDGVANGASGTATTRYPAGIAMDPLVPGNFFFVDSGDLTSGRVRYVNFTNQVQTIGGVTVIAAPSALTPQVTTILQYSPIHSGLWNGTSRMNSIAVFDKQFCYSSGLYGFSNPYYTGGIQGGHNVTCVDRTSPIGAVTMRAGPNETSLQTRGGAPLGTEQEGIAASAATLFTPYGLAFDAAGNLYISERSNHSIRMVRRWW